MVGHGILVGLIGAVMAADPSQADPAVSVTPLPGESVAEAEHWAAQAEVIRQETRGDPLSWSATGRSLGLNRIPEWRASLGVDLPHPLANRARRREGDAEMRALACERLAAVRTRRLEEWLSLQAIADAQERIRLLQVVATVATAAEEAVGSAVAAGAATRRDTWEARTGRVAALGEVVEAEANLRAASERHRALYGEPGSLPIIDPGLERMSEEDLIQRALDADATLAGARYRAQALAAQTERASILSWTWPASVEAIADWEDDKGSREWSFGIQATILLSPREDRHLAVAEEAACAAFRRMSADTVRRAVRGAMAAVRSARVLLDAAEKTRESWMALLAEADEAVGADPVLARRRDALRIRVARMQMDVHEKRTNHRLALLQLTHVTDAPPPR